MKVMFRIPFRAREADILFTYLNNSLFSITVIVAFMFRCGIQAEEVEGDDVFANNVIALYLLLFLPVIAIWSIRFVKYNEIKGFKRFLFVLVATLLFTLLFGITSSIVTFLMLGT